MTHPADIARLAAKFKIEDTEPDPDDPFSDVGIWGLVNALDHAATAYEIAGFPENDSDYADDLDEVAGLLEGAARLLDRYERREHEVNSYRL